MAVSISIESSKKTHEFLRGKGTYEKALNTFKLLINSGINAKVETMLLPSNFNEFKTHIKFFNSLGAKVKIRRAKPSERAMPEKLIITKISKSYIKLVKYINTLSENEVEIEDIMNLTHSCREELITCEKDCGAGFRSVHINQKGDISPCVFLGNMFISGNIKKDKIKNIWQSGKGFKKIRKSKVYAKCKGCEREKICHNECPAIRLWLNKKFNSKDPLCLKDKLKLNQLVD